MGADEGATALTVLTLPDAAWGGENGNQSTSLPYNHSLLKMVTYIHCCRCCWVASVVSDSVRPHRRQPTRLPRPWDSPGKNTGVGCHCLHQCRKVKSESEVAESCPTLSDPMGCGPPGSSIHGIFQARVLEWGAIAFSASSSYNLLNTQFVTVDHPCVPFPLVLVATLHGRYNPY